MVEVSPKVSFSIEKLHLSILRLLAACDLVLFSFLCNVIQYKLTLIVAFESCSSEGIPRFDANLEA
jgi:hypothetical protein